MKYKTVIVIVISAALLILLAVLFTVLARYFYAKKVTPGPGANVNIPEQIHDLRPPDQSSYGKTDLYIRSVASLEVIDVSESGVNHGINIGNESQSNQRPPDQISSSTSTIAPICIVNSNGVTYAADVNQARNVENGSLSNQVKSPPDQNKSKSTQSSSYEYETRNFIVPRV